MGITDSASAAVFIDECGYTGEDLFNNDQPVFCLASIFLSESECADLKTEFFKSVKATELKHASISSGSRNRQVVITFLMAIVQRNIAVKFSTAHKRYVLVTKIVDLIFEPLSHEDGFDLYAEGANIAYSNMLYYAVQDILGEKFFNEMLYRFQKMIRGKTQKTYDDFFKMVTASDFPKIVDELFIFFKYSHVKHGFSVIETLPDFPLDICLSSAFALTAEWSTSIEGEFRVIHDRSSSMAKGKKLWDIIVSPQVQEETVGRDRRVLEFPIRVSQTLLSDSRQSSGLQLADVLAGALTRALKWSANGREPSDKYGAELASLLPGVFKVLPIWPETAFTPEALGTTGPPAKDIIEHFTELMQRTL